MNSSMPCINADLSTSYNCQGAKITSQKFGWLTPFAGHHKIFDAACEFGGPVRVRAEVPEGLLDPPGIRSQMRRWVPNPSGCEIARQLSADQNQPSGEQKARGRLLRSSDERPPRPYHRTHSDSAAGCARSPAQKRRSQVTGACFGPGLVEIHQVRSRPCESLLGRLSSRR